MTFETWKAQLVPSFVPVESEDAIGYLRFYDPSSDRSISQPVRSDRQMADLRGYLPRVLWTTR